MDKKNFQRKGAGTRRREVFFKDAAKTALKISRILLNQSCFSLKFLRLRVFALKNSYPILTLIRSHLKNKKSRFRGGLARRYSIKAETLAGEPKTEDYFAAVCDIFNDDLRRIRKVKSALLTAQKYSWEKSTDRLFEVYDQMFARFQEQVRFFSKTNTVAGFRRAA